MKSVNVILVGSNPLPCYIQAAYVLAGVTKDEEKCGLKKPDIILFVATNETKVYVDCIEKILKENVDKNFNYTQLTINDIYNAAEIEKAIQGKLEEMHNESAIGHILLNNTGGTKTMAVYATAAVRVFSSNNSVEMTECFVDPIKNKIRCYSEKQQNTELFPKTEDLRDKIKLSIEDLIRLHYVNIRDIKFRDLNGKDKRKRDYVKLTDCERRFAEDIIKKDDVYKKYQKFYEKCIAPSNEERVKYQTIDSVKTIVTSSYKLDGEFYKIKTDKISGLKLLIEDERFCTYFDEIKEYFVKGDSWKDEELKSLVLFAGGDWLEKYFYELLLEIRKDLAEEGKNTEIAWSCSVCQNKKDFEVDILALRGYELTLFSISMAETERLAKGKWFEAVYRIEQMAGEHGKAVIVNFLSDDEERLKDFQQDLKTFKRDVTIYQRSSLSDLDVLKQELRKIL